MNKVAAVFELLKVGRSVANPAAWKAGQITVTVLGGAIVGLVEAGKAFGYELPIDADRASDIAWVVIGVANVVLTLTTSKTVGIGKAPVQPDRAPAATPAVADGPLDPGGGA